MRALDRGSVLIIKTSLVHLLKFILCGSELPGKYGKRKIG